MDSASIELFGWSVSKFDAKDVKIDVVSTGRTDAPFASYTLANAVISGYSVSAAGNSQPHPDEWREHHHLHDGE